MKFRSFKDIIDDLIEGIKQAHEQCPDAENKTWEEVCEWAGQHIVLQEEKDDNKT